MTLREMADIGQPAKIEIPEFLESFDVTNVDDFCRYAILKYMYTQKFQEDLETCLMDYEEALTGPFSSSWLELKRDPEGVFTIEMKFGGWTIT